MTTKEYKNNFKMMPERAWLSASINSLRLEPEIAELSKFLTGERDINDVSDIAELNKIRFNVMKLRMYASKCVELIDKMQLEIIDEFDDMRMELDEIGISKDDVFECITPLTLLDTMEIEVGSEIQILDFQNAGSQSQFACSFKKWVGNEKMSLLFPQGYTSMFLLSASQMRENFKKQ